MNNSELLITEYNSDIVSDSELEVYLNDSDTCKCLLLDYRDEVRENLEDLTQVQNFCEIDSSNP